MILNVGFNIFNGGLNVTTNVCNNMTTNVGINMTTECTELIGKLSYKSHREFGSKMISAIRGPQTGLENFSLKHSLSSGYEYQTVKQGTVDLGSVC